ncbi:hypothetical protein SO802_005118 [Lithocarpus litseifolius]|uniref:26S proteasome regulatory subunit RPN7/PSMD6 C-terminal helix domain-containing protein n=1 Tax=Lithocarpus litseifolius TaxID=425828 RepID=A0AAW2DL04_9ROSI
MVESDSVGPAWLGAVMVETRRVREEGNWVLLGRCQCEAGKLHCKIDKVAGVLETNCPDAKSALYQATIKQGDFLLNRIQKLYRVVDL